MIAEDNRGDIFLIHEALQHHHLTANVKVHTDGEEMQRAIAQIDASDLPCPDLVILDLNLPKVDGKELLTMMRASERCRHIPVLIVTSSNAPQDREATERLGASAYFRKPSDLDQFMQLGALVRKILHLEHDEDLSSSDDHRNRVTAESSKMQ